MMPTASHLRNFKQALGTYRRALEEFESALLEFEETPVCEVCGEALTATRRDAKTCSAACRQKAYRRRAQLLSPKGRGKLSRAILDAPVPSLPERERDRG
jgi:RNA polymerase-binding transcription factor DksA